MSPVSATYWGIPGIILFWGLFVIAGALFAQRIYFLFRLFRLGKPENRFDRMGQRIKTMLIEVVPQWCNLKSVTRKDLSGIGHAFLFWGFLLCLTSYIIFIGLAGGFGLSHAIEGTAFETVFLSFLDIAGLLVVLAIVWAAVRRYIVRPQRLQLSAEAAIILSLIFILMVLNVSVEGFGYAANGIEASWPPFGGALASLLSSSGLSQGALEGWFQAVWWAHYGLVLGFMVYVPRSKHLHILLSAFNVLFRTPGSKVVLEPIPLEEGKTSFGVSKIQDFTWKDLLDVNACAVCGRCYTNCPASMTGKTLSPRELVHNLKEHLLEVGPGMLSAKAGAAPEGNGKKLIGDVVTEAEIWACTTCGACQEVCPVGIEHPRKIIEFRRHLMLELSKMPESAQAMLSNMQSRNHPWVGVQSMRLRGDWMSEAGVKVLSEGSSETVDILFWVGCAGALVDRNVTTTLSLVKVLKKAGVNFGVLGAETCCGDPARRVGYEFQFQLMAEQNIEMFKSFNIKEIVTTCPHCYNSLKNEYPAYGGNFKVMHHTELIAQLVRQGKLELNSELNSKLTYQDPCYLGRYNDVYKEPRQVLRAIPKTKVQEMERNKNRSFCCGGGGGHMWIEEQVGTTKINEMRINEVLKTKADTVVTACPYCLQMFDENIERKGIKDSLKAKDFAEIVEAAIKRS